MIFSYFKRNKKPNKINKGFLRIKISDGETWEIPRYEIDSGVPGPTIFLTSGIHGDEISGNIILLKFCNHLKKNPLKCGRIVALIGVNQKGFKILKREIPITNEDLNRLFPGKSNGTVGERIAYAIMQEVKSCKPDLVIDIHNDYFFSTPYVLLDAEKNWEDNLIKTKGTDYAKKTGLVVIEEREDEAEIYTNSFSSFCISEKIPSFTLESGPDKLVVNKFVLTVFNALNNLLISLKMKSSGKIVKFKIDKKVKNKVLKNSFAVYAKDSGTIKYTKDPGELIKKGEIIAKIYNQFGDYVDSMAVAKDLLLIGHSEKAYVTKGEEILWFAEF